MLLPRKRRTLLVKLRPGRFGRFLKRARTPPGHTLRQGHNWVTNLAPRAMDDLLTAHSHLHGLAGSDRCYQKRESLKRVQVGMHAPGYDPIFPNQWHRNICSHCRGSKPIGHANEALGNWSLQGTSRPCPRSQSPNEARNEHSLLVVTFRLRGGTRVHVLVSTTSTSIRLTTLPQTRLAQLPGREHNNATDLSPRLPWSPEILQPSHFVLFLYFATRPYFSHPHKRLI